MKKPIYREIEIKSSVKFEEQKQIDWAAKRVLAVINYPIHTNTVKRNV